MYTRDREEASQKLSRFARSLWRAPYPHGNPNFAKSIGGGLRDERLPRRPRSSISFVPGSPLLFHSSSNFRVVTAEWFVFLSLRYHPLPDLLSLLSFASLLEGRARPASRLLVWPFLVRSGEKPRYRNIRDLWERLESLLILKKYFSNE